MNRLNIQTRRMAQAAAGGALVLASQAHAEVPAEVTTALTEMKADALIVAGLVLVAIIAVVAFKFMRKGF